MKNTHDSIPTPLQTQLLIQSALAALSLIAGIALLILVGLSVALPFLFLTILTAANAARVYHASVSGQYLTITGTVLKVERTTFLRRPKAFLVEVDGKTVRVALRNRHTSLKETTSVTLYIHEKTVIHEWKGLHLLGSYLALEKNTSI